MLFNPPILLVTDGAQAVRPLPEIITDYWQAGGRWVWLREKTLPKAEIINLLTAVIPGLSRDPEGKSTSTIKKIQFGDEPRSRNKPGMTRNIILSNHADVVAAYNLAGVHLPQNADIIKVAAAARAQLKPGQWLGISIHNETELQMAAAAGADYVIAAPVFPTASKPGYGPVLGITGLQQLLAATTIPVIALGGITDETAPQCLATGTAAIAVMGEFMRNTDLQILFGRFIKSL